MKASCFARDLSVGGISWRAAWTYNPAGGLRSVGVEAWEAEKPSTTQRPEQQAGDRLSIGDNDHDVGRTGVAHIAWLGPENRALQSY